MPTPSDATLELKGRFLWPPYPSVTGATPLSGTLTVGYQEHGDYFDSYIKWVPDKANGKAAQPWPKDAKDCLKDQAYNSAIPDNETPFLWLLGGNWLNAQARHGNTSLPISIPLTERKLELGFCSEIRVDGNRTIDCKLHAAGLRSPESQIAVVPVIKIEDRILRNAPNRATAIQRLTLDAANTSFEALPTMKRFTSELLDHLGCQIQNLGVKETRIQFLLDERQLRWTLGPFWADGLGRRGFLREFNESGRLAVSIDNTTRLTLPTNSPLFSLVVTANLVTEGQPTLRIEASWPLGNESGDPTAGATGILRSSMAQIGTAISSMKQVVGAQPESFLLHSHSSSSWSIDGDAAAHIFDGAFDIADGLIRPRNQQKQRCHVSLLSPFSFGREPYGVPNIDADVGTVILPVTLPGIEQSETFILTLSHDPAAYNSEGDDRIVGDHIVSFLVENKDSADSRTWQTRLGAFRFKNDGHSLLAPKDLDSINRLVIAWPYSRGNLSVSDSRNLAILHELRLSATNVVPETVDRPWGDRDERPTPLLVPLRLHNSAAGNAPTFILQVRESIAPDRDRFLVLNLIENSIDTSSNDETFTLLSLQPISIARFTRRRVDRMGDAQNAVVASYNSDDRTWQLKLAVPEYHFEFPPQVVGESADKPSRLELHDINAEARNKEDIKINEDGKILYLRPAPSTGNDGDPERSYLVECRLTPSLDLWVRPSDLDRGYFLPEWQAFEIFRQRNDFGIGVALRGLRGEFLYGLMVGVDPGQETGQAALARVAEIEAITGLIPAQKYVTTTSSDLLSRWSQLRQVLLRRFERLDVWTPAYDQTRPFGYSRFSTGVTFALRNTALHRLPAPIPKDRTFESSIDKDGLRIDPDHGLSGGALWPLESLAFVNRIRELPTSDGGTIERIAISPTSGDADQSASFLNKRMKVVSETRAGFVQMQKVEILGRIGVFWHRAKHVVVYERTVNPSEQFAPVADKDEWHKSRSRRAIIRKVSEYIEILEPSRSYPDDPAGSGNSTHSGFLDSVRFNSKVIHVDSAWSEEIDKGGVTGYAIPLWNLGASQLRPNVYPMPGVTAVTVGEGKESRPLQPRQIANPENLYFYAQASGTEGDSNKWLPVYGVDYGNLIDPAELEKATVPGGSGYGSPGSTSQPGRKPSSPRLLPGYHRFTWRLLPDGARTVLNSGFGGNPVFGSLESFSFSRGTVVSPGGSLKTHLDHADAISAVSEISDFLTDSVSRLKQAIDANDNALLLREAARVVAPFKEVETIFKERVSKLPSQDAIDSVVKEVGLGNAPITCEHIRQRISTTLFRKHKLIAHSLRDWQADLKAELQTWTESQFKDAWEKVGDGLENRERLIRTVVHEKLLGLKRNVDEQFGDIQTTADGILGQVAIARRLVHECVVDFSDTLRKSVGKVRGILGTCQGQLEWSQDRYRKLREQVNEQLAGLVSELTAIRTEVGQRLGAELSPLADNVALALSSEVQKTIEGMTLAFKELSLKVGNPGKPDEVSKRIKNVIEEIEKHAAGLNSFETNLINEVNDKSKGLSDSFAEFSEKLKDVTANVLLWEAIGSQLLVDVGDDTINRIASSFKDAQQITRNDLELIQKNVLARLLTIPDFISAIPDFKAEVPHLYKAIIEGSADVGKLCKKVEDFFNDHLEPLIPKDLKEAVEEKLAKGLEAYEAIKSVVDSADAIKAKFEAFETAARNISTAWNGTVSSAQAYSSRVMEGFNRLDKGGVAAVPGNALRLLSAATTAPEIAQMQANIDRMRCSYNNAKVETSKALASLSKLGDALKALGIEIPFDGISDKLEIPEEVLQGFDFKRLFPSFGGLDLSGLLGDVKIPNGVKDAVRIRHEFDKAKFRAWVEVDVDVPVPGRRKLFGLGPFVMYFRDSLLTGRMRAEASQDSDQTTTNGSGVISTNIDVDIGGERILSLERGEIRFSQGSGLKFSFDAKNIKLHSALQFVQDTLGQLIGDNIGGMKILKERGIPVGVEHDFKLPTISLMGVTSGVSNIQLSNTFRLRAYPDFVLSNRFNLSRPELPFIFSFFIVGGTGYSVVDASYRPFDQSLSVSVEGAAGGSAALGIAFGPVSGSVFFTLSLALTYQKSTGPSGATGDGLTVSFVMVMAGNVTVWGFIDIYLGVMLRLSYQENGAIDAKGSVSIEVEVCMFLTLSFSAEAEFRMKDGESTTTSQTNTSVEEGERIKQLREKADQLQGARA